MHKYPILNEDDKIFVNRIKDMIYISENKYINKFSCFLNPRQQIIAKITAENMGFDNFKFFGGLDNCERKVFSTHNEHSIICDNDFPITAYTFSYRHQDVLTHRDFLGCFMSMKVKRECIGDIFVGKSMAVLFILSQISDIIRHVSKIGKIGVKCEEGIIGTCPNLYSTENINTTVNSLRLDNIISSAILQSRQKTANIIKTGSVSLNYFECNNVSQIVKIGDIFSVRGYGKFKIIDVNGFTKKGRTHITFTKYI